MDKDNDDLETIRKTLPALGMTGTYIGDEPEPVKKRQTVTLDSLGSARLTAIRQHIADTSGFPPPTKAWVVSRALEYLCELEEVPDPAKAQEPQAD